MTDLIKRLRREADISARPGQMDRLNALAEEFDAALKAAREDGERLDYVMRHLRGSELRRIGIHTNGGDHRPAIDQARGRGCRVRDLIGKPVRIEWRRPQDDWPTFTLLAYEPPMVHLRGRDDGERKHNGDTFWVNAAEIVSIVPDKESTNEA